MSAGVARILYCAVLDGVAAHEYVVPFLVAEKVEVVLVVSRFTN